MRYSFSAFPGVGIWSLAATSLLAGIALATGQLRAEELEVKILDYGIYQAGNGVVVPTRAETSGSALIEGSSIKHIRTTKKIPLRLGHSFGFEYRVTGLAPGEHTFEYVTIHPSIPQPDGKVLTKSSFARKLLISEGGELVAYDGWEFLEGYEYELVPGTWTKCIYIDGKLVTSMSFDVGDFEPQPEKPGAL